MSRFNLKSLPTPTNLNNDRLVELALMREFGIITSLLHGKYSSPMFAKANQIVNRGF